MTTAGRDNGAPGTEWHELWSLHECVSVESGPGEESLAVRGRWGEVTLRQPSPAVRQALNRMGLGPVSLRNVIGERDSDPAGWEELQRVLERLDPLIIRSLRQERGEPLVSVVPLTIRSRFRPAPLAADIPVRLSTYAQLRTDGRKCSIESPLALHRVVLHRAESVRLIAPLISPITPAVYRAGAHAHPVVAAVLEYLVAAGMVVVAESAAGSTPVFAEDSDPRLIGWSPADMMFHARSTLGRHDHDFGAIFPADGAASAKPASRARVGPGVPLHTPRWADLYVIDPALTAVMEGRHPQPRHGRAPVTAVQVGELLYRAARTMSLGASTPGGAAFEFELYLTVRDCVGLERGVYHYDPFAHSLGPVDTDRIAWQELLRSARMAAGGNDLPQVLITITVRFRQSSWRLEGPAYRLMLMSAGALMQSLYLVSTAMCLATCAIGAVGLDAVAPALGIDWRLEPCVGHFMVSTYPAASAPAVTACTTLPTIRSQTAAQKKPSCAAHRRLHMTGVLVLAGGCHDTLYKQRNDKPGTNPYRSTVSSALLASGVRRSLAQIRYVSPVLPGEASGLVARVYDQAERDFGLVAPPLVLHSPAPQALAAAWLMLRETLLATGPAAREQKEVVAAAVSVANECPYCVAVHSSAVRGLIGGSAPAQLAAGRFEEIADPVLRDIATWAASAGRPGEAGPAPLPVPADRFPELAGVAVTFHYLNRMVSIFLPESPLPPLTPKPMGGWVMGMLASAMLAPAPVPGASLDLLPDAPLPAEFSWAADHPHIAGALARAAATVDNASQDVVPEPVREIVLDRLRGWDGRPPGIDRGWAQKSAAGLAAADRPAGRLALLAAFAPYQVTQDDIREVKSTWSEALIMLTAWASMAPARTIASSLRPR